jgi:hypothetical protein
VTDPTTDPTAEGGGDEEVADEGRRRAQDTTVLMPATCLETATVAGVGADGPSVEADKLACEEVAAPAWPRLACLTSPRLASFHVVPPPLTAPHPV